MNKLDRDYISLINEILKDGNWKTGRNGRTVSLFGKTIRHKMSDGFPLLTTKRLSFKNIFEELMWFLRGDTNIQSLVQRNVNIWTGDAYKRYKTIMEPKWEAGGDILEEKEFTELIKNDNEFADKWGELGPTYGKQWRNWGYSIDQIQDVIDKLKTSPDDRRMLVSAWNVAEVHQTVLPPCHSFFQFYSRELTWEERYDYATRYMGISWFMEPRDSDLDFHKVPSRAVSLQFNMRSVDVPLGMPYNIASYGLLLTLIAKYVNMIPDELIGIFGDTHIYENQIESLSEQLNREPYKLPKLSILKRDFYRDISHYQFKDLNLVNYQFHPSINIPLSN